MGLESATRQHFSDELARVEEQALGGLDLVAAQLDRTIDAIQHQDVELASLVVASDDVIDGRYLEVHQALLTLLALQAPVAGDLRVLAALLHTMRSIERMGDQCVNIAKTVPLTGNEPPRHAELVELLVRMGRAARAEVMQAKRSFADRDVDMAWDLVRTDREINGLNRQIFQLAIAVGENPDVREWATHMVMVGRAFERIGDNAVDIGEQTAFVVSGLFREFSDARFPDGVG
ncbi:MAG: phosphate signaling complex protein PhoU [Baekduia sp.]